MPPSSAGSDCQCREGGKTASGLDRWAASKRRRRTPLNMPTAGKCLQAESLAEIDATHILVCHDFGRASIHQDRSIMQDVCPVDNIQRFTDVMVGDQHTDAA